jgi:hypothetical protein
MCAQDTSREPLDGAYWVIETHGQVPRVEGDARDFGPDSVEEQ